MHVCNFYTFVDFNIPTFCIITIVHVIHLAAILSNALWDRVFRAIYVLHMLLFLLILQDLLSTCIVLEDIFIVIVHGIVDILLF